MKVSKSKHKVLHLEWGNPRHDYRLGKVTESSPAKKDVRVLVDRKQYALTAPNSNLILRDLSAAFQHIKGAYKKEGGFDILQGL